LRCFVETSDPLTADVLSGDSRPADDREYPVADANVDIVIDCADPETLAEFWAEALGARRIDVGQGSDPGWIAMADPEGNEFCVCPGVPLPTAR
jgi:hypothetical protein